MVNSPSDQEKFKLSTLGTEEMGEVPRLDLVIKLTPKELIKSPSKNTR